MHGNNDQHAAMQYRKSTDSYHNDHEIAAMLNEHGYQSGEGLPFRASIIRRISGNYRLKTRFDRLPETGMLTVREMAILLGVTPQTVKLWKNHGLRVAPAYNEKNEYLYERPGADRPRKMQGLKGKLSNRPRLSPVPFGSHL